MNKPEAQEPIRVQRDRDEVETHPAYAMIGASRVSGGPGRLFASEFNHQHYVTISICAAELHRNLSRDWHFGRNEYIEVSLSEAQWASFVSSMNVGSGVPCTLNRRNGEMVPQIKGQAKTKTMFKQELGETLKTVTDSLGALEKQINESKLSGKAKDELLASLRRAMMNLAPNLSFVADQFSEHIETTLEHAKIEVGAYVQAVISRTGIEALRGQSPIEITQGDAL
jgi:hypothetical protein